jgi:hypothetical protein
MLGERRTQHMLKQVRFGDLPDGTWFYREPSQQQFEKTPLDDVGKWFPDYPNHLFRNRSLSNYRLLHATKPEHYFAWLPSNTMVYVEEEE